MPDSAVTLQIDCISIICHPSFDEERVSDLRGASARALENWSDVFDLLRSVAASPVVQLTLTKGEIHCLIDNGDAWVTAVSVPAKAKGYDVLAKILRQLEHSSKRPR